MDVIMPQLGESVEEGTVAIWHKKPGDRVEIDEILLEIETDKVATEVPSLVAGIVKDIKVAEGETARVGTILCVIEADGAVAGKPAPASAVAPAPAPAPSAPPVPARRPGSRPRTAPDGTPLSPAVRRLIVHHGLDAGEIRGTGRGGRIQRKDVLAHLDAGGSAAVAPATAGAAPAYAPVRAAGRDVEAVPFSTIRKRIAHNMNRSKALSAHVLQAVEVDFSAVERVRVFMKAAWKAETGTSLSYLPFIARAVCLALPDFPDLNAERDGDRLLRHRRIDMAFAIDLDRSGLLAPVLRDAGSMRVPALARGIAELARRARAGEIKPDEMAGAGYTITNNGSFGTLITAPIINQPQVAILSSDGIRKRPVVVECESGDEIVIRPVGILAQSFDHCVIDGSYSGSFLNRVKDILETRDWSAEFI